MTTAGRFNFAASYSYRTRARGHQSESGGEDDDIAEIGVVKKTDAAEVEFIEPSAENLHWSATFGKEFDSTSAIIRIKTYRRKVTEAEFNEVVNNVTSAEEDRQVRHLRRTWRDEGILPDVLYLLWCRKKEKGPESHLAALSQGIAQVTFQQALDMLTMVARFLHRFEQLRAEERFVFSMDQQQTNKLLAFQSQQKWVILAVPTVRINKKTKACVEGNYLRVRVHYLTRLHQQGLLLIVKPVEPADTAPDEGQFRPYWDDGPRVIHSERARQILGKRKGAEMVGPLRVKSKSDVGQTVVDAETPISPLKTPWRNLPLEQFQQYARESPQFHPFPRLRPHQASEMAVMTTESTVVVPTADDQNPMEVDNSEVEKSGGENQSDDGTSRRSAEGSVVESADPYGIEGERWALHTRLHLDHIEHLGEEMAKELDKLAPEGWEEPPWVQADDQVMVMMAERAEKQFQTTSYRGMVHQLVYHARGYTVGSLGKWLPDGAAPMLAKLMEEEHLRPPSRGAPFGSEIRQVEGVKPLYYIDHDQVLLDCREKTAVDSYEMGEGQSSTALVCTHNLFNQTRHRGFATYFSQGIFDEESGLYVQLPVVRLIEVLAQHLVAYGTPEEVTTAQMYFFKRVSRLIKSGGDETFLLADTVESREEAEQLYRDLFKPTVRKPLTLQQARVIPRIISWFTAMHMRASVEHRLDGNRDLITSYGEAHDLLTVGGQPLGPIPLLPMLLLPTDAVRCHDASLWVGDGTLRGFLMRSDRPDMDAAIMRSDHCALNVVGEAITNGIHGAVNGLITGLSWETFDECDPPKEGAEVSDFVRNRCVFIGGHQAYALAKSMGSSWCGAQKCDITDVFVGVDTQTAPLWQKDRELAAAAFVFPDDSDAFLPRGLLDIPTKLNDRTKDVLIVASGTLVFQTAESLWRQGITPIVVDKLVRARETSDVDERGHQWVQRGEREMGYKAALLFNGPIVSLSGRVFSAMTNKNHYGTTKEEFLHSLGPPEDLKFIHAAIENVVKSAAVQKFWEPGHQSALIFAHTNPVFEPKPMRFDRFFTYEIHDCGARLVYTGNMEKLKGKAEIHHEAELHLSWVNRCIDQFSFHINSLAASTPSGCDQRLFPVFRTALKLVDSGVTLEQVMVEQANPVLRAMTKNWAAAARPLGRNGRLPLRTNSTLNTMSLKYLTPADYIGPNCPTLEQMWMKDSQERAKERGETTMASVDRPVSAPWVDQITPAVPPAHSPSCRRQIAFPRRSESPLVGAKSPVLLKDDYKSRKEAVEKFLLDQQEKDWVRVEELSHLTAGAKTIREYLEDWWVENVKRPFDPTSYTAHQLKCEAVRRDRKSGLYSTRRQGTLSVVRANANFRGFFDAIPPPPERRSSMDGAEKSQPGGSGTQLPSKKSSSEPRAKQHQNNQRQGGSERRTQKNGDGRKDSTTSDTLSIGVAAVKVSEIAGRNVEHTGDDQIFVKCEPRDEEEVQIVGGTESLPMPMVGRSKEDDNTSAPPPSRNGTSSRGQNRPESAAAVITSPLPPAPLHVVEGLMQLARERGMPLTKDQAEELVAGRGKRLKYPEGREVADFHLLEYCELPTTRPLTLETFYSVTVQVELNTRLGMGWPSLAVKVLRGVVFNWLVAQEKYNRNNAEDLSRESVAKLIGKADIILKGILPDRIKEFLEDSRVLCD